jgi:hypothetical protein
MFITHSYQDVLSERAESSNLVMSAWFVLLAVAVFMLASA